MDLDLDLKYVYRGVWVDLDRGQIMGKTITTDTGTGTLLVALLALLVTLGTAHLWHIIQFAVHQLRADGKARDGLFRQQQALLRTLPSPSTILADSLKLWWAWRKDTKRPFLRSLLLIFLALLMVSGTISASIFSSFVVKSSDLTVLVNSPFCGAPDAGLRRTRGGDYSSTVNAAAQSYGPLCYQSRDNETIPKSCNTFIKRYIDFEIGREDCPFEKSMCVADSVADAFVMESALLDANTEFGLNLPADSRIKYRRKATCSVLSLENRTSVYNVSDLLLSYGRGEFVPGERIVTMNYGQSQTGDNWTQATSLEVSNMTFKYEMSGQIYYANPGLPVRSRLEIIPELRRKDGDTGLKTIGLNGMRYLAPVDDPLFSAHLPSTALGIDESENPRLIRTYTHDYPLKAIGCLQQYQFCHVRSGREDFCTDLMALPANVTEINFPEANDLQRAAISLFVNTSYTFDNSMPSSNWITQRSALAPSLHIAPPPPEGMWYIELIGWETELWAMFQIAITDWAIGPSVRAGGNWEKPATPAEKQLCGMQKMKVSGNVVNINVFALAFIIAFSTLVMVIDIALLKFMVYLSSFRRALGAPRIDRWIQDGIWQLQRRAYEGEGYRQWTDLEAEIPLNKGQMLKDLPILWVPEKGKAVRTFSSVDSSDSHLPLRKVPLMRDEERCGP